MGTTMSVTTIMTLLAAMAAVTALVTQAVKAFLDSLKVRYVSNIVVLVIALAVGCGGTALFYENNQIPFNALTSVWLALMGIANWMTAMVGYDKVKQMLMQITDMNKE